MITVILVIHLIITIALVGVILLQRSEGGALGIGGSSSGGSLFTARGAANALTRTTAILATAFFITSILLTMLSVTDVIPYAPLVLDAPDATTGVDGFWWVGSVLLAVNALLIVFGVGVMVKMENLRHADELETLGMMDGLTGLGNRREFDSRLAMELARTARSDMPLSLALLDLDHFKRINDTWGHLAGDRVLAEVGRILRESTREYDVSTRYGGEEFALILPDTRLQDAATLMDRLRDKIEKHVFAVEGAEIRLTASVGLAAAGTGAADAEQMVRAADEALYAAKHQGRNRVVTADGLRNT